MRAGRLWQIGGLLTGFAVSFAGLAQCPAQIRLPYNSSWLPYIVVTGEKVSGTDIELIRHIMQDIGSELQLVPRPESRALTELASGKVDLLFGASYTEERAVYAWFSEPYRHEVNVVLVHPQVLARFPELTSKTAFLDLAQRKLVGTFNPKGFYGLEFEQLKQLAAVQQRSVPIFDAEQRLALVLSQRADYTLSDQTSILTRFAEQPVYQQLVLLPFELARAKIHLMMSKKTLDADCVKRINQSLRKRRQR